MRRESAEATARVVLARQQSLSPAERRALRWVIDALERSDHSLTCSEWLHVLEAIDPTAYHYRLPSACKVGKAARRSATA